MGIMEGGRGRGEKGYVRGGEGRGKVNHSVPVLLLGVTPPVSFPLWNKLLLMPKKF